MTSKGVTPRRNESTDSNPKTDQAKPRQVTVQPLERKPDKGDPHVPPSQEDEAPRRGRDGRDVRTGQNRDGLPQ